MKRLLLAALALVPLILSAQDKVNLAAVHRIKQEAFENSRVMEHLFYLVDVHGPRLTGSPGFQGAADFAVRRMKEWGLVNAKQEKWGPFGHGWSYSRFAAHLVEPQYEALIGVPMAWSPGTGGVVTGEPVLTPLKTPRILKHREAEVDAFIEKHRGKLGEKIVMIAPLEDVKVSDKPLHRRFSNAELGRRAAAPVPVPPD